MSSSHTHTLVKFFYAFSLFTIFFSKEFNSQKYTMSSLFHSLPKAKIYLLFGHCVFDLHAQSCKTILSANWPPRSHSAQPTLGHSQLLHIMICKLVLQICSPLHSWPCFRWKTGNTKLLIGNGMTTSIYHLHVCASSFVIRWWIQSSILTKLWRILHRNHMTLFFE